jgi:GTP cyclohydrolase I
LSFDLRPYQFQASAKLNQEPYHKITIGLQRSLKPSKNFPVVWLAGLEFEMGKTGMGYKQAVDLPRIQAAVREILLAVGEDPDREGLLETPARVARMYAEVFSGLREDPKVHLAKTFNEKYDEIVLVKDIRFSSCCEHHLLPFHGKTHIGYLPNGKIVGLSKLARTVDVIARRPQVQERMTENLADLLMDELGAKAVGVVVEATHSCMTMRGVRKPGSLCTTSAMRGTFRANQASRVELLSLIYGGKI